MEAYKWESLKTDGTGRRGRISRSTVSLDGGISDCFLVGPSGRGKIGSLYLLRASPLTLCLIPTFQGNGYRLVMSSGKRFAIRSQLDLTTSNLKIVFSGRGSWSILDWKTLIEGSGAFVGGFPSLERSSCFGLRSRESQRKQTKKRKQRRIKVKLFKKPPIIMAHVLTNAITQGDPLMADSIKIEMSHKGTSVKCPALRGALVPTISCINGAQHCDHFCEVLPGRSMRIVCRYRERPGRGLVFGFGKSKTTPTPTDEMVRQGKDREFLIEELRRQAGNMEGALKAFMRRKI